ncbi:MAG: hypothetical protein XD40_0322 [Archaeoglobus fulgidus]|uniref:S-layer protein n=1 Tax=Archaeoglobus fulgidus TaxID=2234 RepID=A0A124FC52_ARCFL|nr:COG1361 S-layer family protein [Archaeoglobus fulgidus]KUJ94549.1 MAG: hypothetical protein XD40_0322 [Archaeoglobus fulgidus]KUK07599.1 MAG: hypothetical protein XD48_0111 [Archaeoglobus fulgidus]
MRAPLLATAVAFLLIYPAVAQEISASIDFHASVAGSNVLHPGDKKAITIVLSCEVVGWLDNPLPINENTSNILPMLTTAKSVILEPRNSQIEVESESILVGDVPCGRAIPVSVVVSVDKDIYEGKRALYFDITYSKAKMVPVGNNYTINFETGLETSVDVEFEVKKKDYDFDVISITSDLVAGREGVLKVKLENTGEKALEDAIFILNATPPLMVEPKAMSVYAGNLDAGESFEAMFKVYVPEGVFQQSYPAEVVAVFRTSSGMPYKLSKPIGLKIEGAGYFEVEKIGEFLSPAKTLRVEQSVQIPSIPLLQQQSSEQKMSNVVTIPSRGYLALRITNTGDEIRDAFAVLSFDNPLLKSTSTPYLGDVKRGESRDVVFYITSSAPPGSYLGYVVVKYRDEYGDEAFGPKIYVSVNVSPAPALKVSKVETSNLGIGLVGEVKLSFAQSDARNVKLYLLSPDSTVSPVTSSSYVESSGDTATFRVKVSNDAVAGNHLLYLVETFDDDFASDLVSVEEFPIYVAPKLAAFQVVSVRSDLKPDSTGDVVVELKNAGNAEIYNAVVMLEVSPPLSIAGTGTFGGMLGESQPGEYFVGTVKPGDVVTARFRVDVDKDAGEGSYPASIKVKYYDESNYEHTSNSIVVSLEVKPSPPYILYAAICIAAIGFIIGAAIVRKRRKQ